MTDNILPEGKIVRAAIIFRGKTYTGWRHADIRNDIINIIDPPRLEISNTMADPWSVGFVTENGRFLTRNQAQTYGQYIGQLKHFIGSVLTSEDLWDNNGNPT
jgi:hypothetical protein